jgi:flavin-dependent dehydrogenase
MESFDVVVVGAGLAGLQCTRLLAGHGLRVALVDRKESLSESVHTTGIFVRRSLEDFALPAAHLGPPIRHVTIYAPSRRAVDIVSDRDEFRIGRMGPLYQRLLKDCQAAGGDWLPATSFLSATKSSDGSQVVLRTAGRERTIHCRMLVGADGTNSRVARELGLSENRRWIVGMEEVYERNATTGLPRLHCFFDRRIAPGYIAWIADDGHSVHVGVGGYAEKFQPPAALGKFRASIESLVPLAGAKLVERRGGRIPVGCVLENVISPRGLLLGDAAGAVSPLTAGGLDPCLRLSELAAKSVYQFLSTGDPAALAVYDGRYLRKRYLARRALRRVYDLVGSNAVLELGCAALRTRLGLRAARKIFFTSGSSPIAAAPVAGRELAPTAARGRN